MTPEDYKKIWHLVVNKSSKKPYDVYVGRPSKFGNPFSHQEHTIAKYRTDTREEALDKFEEWVLSQPEMVAMIKRELKNKVLCCFCSPQRCHAHFLAYLANQD
jgi:hypothetical protein